MWLDITVVSMGIWPIRLHELFICLFLDLAQAVVDTGAVPLLVLCIQEPEIALKRIAASALSDISKHSPEVSYEDAFTCKSEVIIGERAARAQCLVLSIEISIYAYMDDFSRKPMRGR
jgi:hypothetical protein